MSQVNNISDHVLIKIVATITGLMINPNGFMYMCNVNQT